MRIRSALRVVAAPAVVALLAAACGGGGQPGSGPGGSAAPVTIGAGTVFAVGTVLINSAHRTLYVLVSAPGGKVVPCTSKACTSVWPPVLLPPDTSAARAGPGVKASKLGTVKVPAGTQVTYFNRPLHTFSGDERGQATGRGIASFGGVWHPMTPSGQPLSILVG
jgi:predicted lipoprotein with Yx(FWY)xxD motif